MRFFVRVVLRVVMYRLICTSLTVFVECGALLDDYGSNKCTLRWIESSTRSTPGAFHLGCVSLDGWDHPCRSQGRLGRR